MMLVFYSKSKDANARYLSNYTKTDVLIIDEAYFPTPNNVLRDKVFPTIEHAFQAYKLARSHAPEHIINKLINTPDPSVVKRMGGRKFFNENGLTLYISEWNHASVHIMRYLVRQRLHIDDKYRDIIQKAVNNNIKLCHFERSGKRSIWGGFLDKNTGEWVGQNKLGQILEDEYLLI